MFCELAAACGQLDRLEEAKAAVAQFERRKLPGFGLAAFRDAHLHMCARAQEAERWREGYGKAGLPA